MEGPQDFLMRRFLGEHHDAARESVQRDRELMDNSQYPNLEDLPERASGPEGEMVNAGNVFWSEWANDEHRLRQMRPTHLPPPSGGSGGQTADEHPESVGTDAMFSAALEMDRQTSVGRYRPLDALTFLAEAGNMVRSGPEYYHMAAGEDDHAGGFVGQANDERATSVASRTGPLGIRSNSDHERDGQRAGPQGSATEDLVGTLRRGTAAGGLTSVEFLQGFF